MVDIPAVIDDGVITSLPYAMVLSLGVSLSLVVFGAIYQVRRTPRVSVE